MPVVDLLSLVNISFGQQWSLQVLWLSVGDLLSWQDSLGNGDGWLVSDDWSWGNNLQKIIEIQLNSNPN